MFKYPYGDSQQLNLDWILRKIKELEHLAGTDITTDDIENVNTGITGVTLTQALINLATTIAYNSQSDEILNNTNIGGSSVSDAITYLDNAITYLDKLNRLFLPSTNNTDDRAQDITNKLTTYGTVILGNGDFYISPITMPANTSIIGLGNTNIKFISGRIGTAITISPGCRITNINLDGLYNSIFPDDFSGTIQERRYGIGNFTDGVVNALVSDVVVTNFGGAGFYFTTGSTNTASGVQVTNSMVRFCEVGVYLLTAEFNNFTNVKIHNCGQGVINQGANNIFDSCHLSRNLHGINIDNSDGSISNFGHSIFTGCVIQHTGATSTSYGDAIYVNRDNSGTLFVNCEVYYSNIEVINSTAIFDALNMGSGNTITLTNCKEVIFSNCIATNKPTLNITNSPAITFTNCLVKSTGEPWRYNTIGKQITLAQNVTITITIPNQARALIVVCGSACKNLVIIISGNTGNVTATKVMDDPNNYLTITTSPNTITLTNTSSNTAFAYYLTLSASTPPVIS